MHTDEFPICITLVSPTYTSLSLSLITSSLTTSRRKKGIIIKNNNNTYSPHLHHFIFPLYTYIHTHTDKWIRQKDRRNDLLFSRAFHFAQINAPVDSLSPKEKERKKEERDTVQRTGAFLEIGFPRRQWRRRRRPEIERSQSPLLRSKCREKTGSRLFLQSAVDWIVRRPFLRLRRTERERERGGREHVRYTRLAVSRALSSFLLVSSFAREEDPFLERHQSARFFRPKKAEPPLPLNPRPLPPLLPRGFPPPNDFQRAREIEILLSIWKMKFNKSYLIIYRLLLLYININT